MQTVLVWVEGVKRGKLVKALCCLRRCRVLRLDGALGTCNAGRARVESRCGIMVVGIEIPKDDGCEDWTCGSVQQRSIRRAGRRRGQGFCRTVQRRDRTSFDKEEVRYG
jgi:hypothetical protein